MAQDILKGELGNFILPEKNFIRNKSGRLSIEYIRKKFLDAGYTLLSEEYKNNKQLLEYECSSNHHRKIRWNDFQQGHRCAECQNMHSPKFSYVVKKFGEEGYTLLSVEFVNAHKDLYYICPKGHLGWITWHSFRKGCGCEKCGGTKRKTLGEVRERFLDACVVLLSTEYHNSSTKLKCLCKNDHIFYTSVSAFRNRCPVCSIGPVSRISQKWLDAKKIPEEFREFTLFCGDKKFIVDGFDPVTNTVLEFFGDYWHGNPNVHDQDAVHPYGKTYGQLFDETMARLFLLRQHGYNLEIIWEEDFQILSHNPLK